MIVPFRHAESPIASRAEVLVWGVGKKKQMAYELQKVLPTGDSSPRAQLAVLLPYGQAQ